MTKPSIRNALFLLLSFLSVSAFWAPLRTLLWISIHRESHTHILVIVPVSVLLVLHDRRRIFANVRYSPAWMAMMVLLGIVGHQFGRQYAASGSDVYQSAAVLMFVGVLVAAFLALFGSRAATQARFPLALLLLLVPFPMVMLDRLIWFLQAGSAEATYVLLRICGVPTIREGFLFRMPRLSVEVAQQCSGIRSSIALALTVLFVGHFTLRSFWRKVLLVLLVVPVVILKNGIRITTLSLLSIYVDPGYISGPLHHEGGIVFYILGLITMVPLWWWLRKSDASKPALQSAAMTRPATCEPAEPWEGKEMPARNH